MDWITPRLALAALAGLIIGGCQPPPPPPADEDTLPANPTPDLDDREETFTWSAAFDAGGVGALSAVWGSSPDDVFIVGGTPTAGEVYHYDGAAWRQMHIPNVPLLVWIFGFGPDDVYAVGLDGGAIHFDGSRWTTLDTGTDQDLWGVWGRSRDDLWIVGGDVGRGEPVLIHFDGKTFTPSSVPPNDREATSLFKIWGTQTKLFAVGENGLIIEYDGSGWAQVSAGADADEDFVALWGSDDSNIVAVGGRTGGRIAVYDGQSWSTQKLTGVPGLNGVFMTSPSECIVAGVNGYIGNFDLSQNLLTAESGGDSLDIHAVWGDEQGRYYGVGGRFRTPFEGLALVRTIGDPGLTPAAPIPATAISDCNGNGIDDADDIAGGDSSDCDGNGVPDECQTDSDGDGLIDACDECPDDPEKSQPGDCGCGTPDTDSDNDGVPDCIDICPGMDDFLDTDGDGVPDCFDICPGFDDKLDTDGDGVPNGCDDCDGDNLADSDGDGVPDDCDVCPGFDDSLDSDGDGIPDCLDICPGFDDTADTDGDGTPDGCDECPNDPNKTEAGDCGCGNPETDSDGDGVPDCLDECPDDPNKTEPGDCGCGVPDEDVNQNGVPDCLETFCNDECECELGENCVDGVCQPTDDPDLELAVGGAADPYIKLCNNDPWTNRVGFQGFVEAGISLRASGFPPNARVELQFNMRHADGRSIRSRTINVTLTETEPGVNVLYEWRMILTNPLCDLCNQEVILDVQITDIADPTIRAASERRLVLVLIDEFNNFDCERDCP